MTSSFQIGDRIRSFHYAFAGIWTMLKTQQIYWLSKKIMECHQVLTKKRTDRYMMR